MSINLPSLFSQQFSTNVQLLLQQRDSRFASAAMSGTHRGETASPVDQVGKIAMQPVTSRYENKTRTDAPVDRRWVDPSPFDSQQLEDSFDRLKMISDIRSAYTQNAVNAANRKKDELLIAAFFATAKTGKQGGTSTTFPTSTATNVVSVSEGGTTSNLNMQKLKKGVELLLTNDVDLDNEQVYCALGPKQNTALLNEIEVINGDYRGARVDGQGRVMSWNGIEFIHSNLLTTGTDDAAGTSRALPMWCRSGMHLGVWENPIFKVRIAEEFKSNPWEVYAYMMMGATRIEEGKVIKIWARE